MAGNTFGQIFRVTTFGESHGEMIGVVIDGCPAGLELDTDFIQLQLDRRKPGQSKITTQRKESDLVQFVSGVFEGKTTGAPLAAIIRNEDQRSKDYAHIADQYRPSHADFTYDQKYGHRDHRGGGRSSARETAARVVAGGVAQLLLKKAGIEISAYVSQVGNIRLETEPDQVDLSQTETNMVRCPDAETAAKMISLIESVRKDGDTIGGVVSCLIKGCPAGLGEPVFDRLHADLGKAMLSINAVKGFEYGSGFSGVEMRGSQHNDRFIKEEGATKTLTNHSGGIQGGISNGMPIYFRVAFKPVATLMRSQPSLDKSGKAVSVEGRGRHDPCVVPRAVPIVEAMAAITLADHTLRHRAARMESK
jgi:chorismate synthase